MIFFEGLERRLSLKRNGLQSTKSLKPIKTRKKVFNFFADAPFFFQTALFFGQKQRALKGTVCKSLLFSMLSSGHFRQDDRIYGMKAISGGFFSRREGRGRRVAFGKNARQDLQDKIHFQGRSSNISPSKSSSVPNGRITRPRLTGAMSSTLCGDVPLESRLLIRSESHSNKLCCWSGGRASAASSISVNVDIGFLYAKPSLFSSVFLSSRPRNHRCEGQRAGRSDLPTANGAKACN
jgi:hypothetical protein